MSTPIILVLALALIAVSVCGAASIWFVCKLAGQVSKLNAARTVEEYAQLSGVDRRVKPIKEESKPEDQASADGTLSSEALDAVSSKIE